MKYIKYTKWIDTAQFHVNNVFFCTKVNSQQQQYKKANIIILSEPALEAGTSRTRVECVRYPYTRYNGYLTLCHKAQVDRVKVSE